MYNPSPYQTAIHDRSKGGNGNIIIQAVAGSGKSTTIVQDVKRLSAAEQCGTMFVAFNNSIVKELQTKLPTAVTTNTIHSFGFRALGKSQGRKLNLNKFKEDEISTSVVENAGYKVDKEEGGEGIRLMEAVKDAMHFCKLTLIDPTDYDAFAEMVHHYDLEDHDKLQDLTVQAYNRSIAEWQKHISFDDMIFLPVHFGIRMPTFDRIYVDECQDLNNCQRELIRRSVSRFGGRFIGVGDRWQSIYGFAGADVESFDRLIDTFNAEELPLSICYRCPTSHLELAKKYVPQIEARPGAPEGDIISANLSDLVDIVDHKAGDIIICRKKAPLFRAATRLLANQIPAKVKGADVVKSIIRLAGVINKMAKGNWSDFVSASDEWYNTESDRIQKFKSASYREIAQETLNDKMTALDVLFTGAWTLGIRDYRSFKKWASEIYTEEKAGGVVMLSTVHRAKGLETNRVFRIETNPIKVRPGEDGEDSWQQAQEDNLAYVSLTRAKQLLAFVKDDEEEE